MEEQTTMLGEIAVATPNIGQGANPYAIAASLMQQDRENGELGGISDMALNPKILAFLDKHKDRLTGVTLKATITAAPERRESASSTRVNKEGKTVPTKYYVATVAIPDGKGGIIPQKVLSPTDVNKIAALTDGAPCTLFCVWNEERQIRRQKSPGYDVTLNF